MELCRQFAAQVRSSQTLQHDLTRHGLAHTFDIMHASLLKDIRIAGPWYVDSRLAGGKYDIEAGPDDEGEADGNGLARTRLQPLHDKTLKLIWCPEMHVLQVMQNFLGYSEYEVLIKSVAPDRSKAHGGALAHADVAKASSRFETRASSSPPRR